MIKSIFYEKYNLSNQTKACTKKPDTELDFEVSLRDSHIRKTTVHFSTRLLF